MRNREAAYSVAYQGPYHVAYQGPYHVAYQFSHHVTYHGSHHATNGEDGHESQVSVVTFVLFPIMLNIRIVEGIVCNLANT
jgi:hypothetical protein